MAEESRAVVGISLLRGGQLGEKTGADRVSLVGSSGMNSCSDFQTNLMRRRANSTMRNRIQPSRQRLMLG